MLADHVDVDPEVLSHRASAAILEHPLLVARHVQRPALAPVDGLSCFGFEPRIELGRCIAHLRERTAGAEAPHHARRMPRRAATDLRLLKQHNVLLTRFGEVVRDAGANHTAANDDDACATRYSCSHEDTCLDMYNSRSQTCLVMSRAKATMFSGPLPAALLR